MEKAPEKPVTERTAEADDESSSTRPSGASGELPSDAVDKPQTFVPATTSWISVPGNAVFQVCVTLPVVLLYAVTVCPTPTYRFAASTASAVTGPFTCSAIPAGPAPSTTQMICGEAGFPATKIAPSGPCATVRPVSADENAPLMATSANRVSAPVGPGVGKALELDAAGSCVGSAPADPTGADAPGDATDDGGSAFVVAGVDAAVDDPALACGALTDEVTGADGPPECEAMQAVLVRASAATPQPVATARRTLTLDCLLYTSPSPR